MRNSNVGSFDKLFSEYGAFKNAALASSGALLNGFRLNGIEPDSLTKDDLLNLNVDLSNLYNQLPDRTNIVQYYIKLGGYKSSFIDRSSPISSLLANRRKKYIDSKSLYTTYLYHIFEQKQIPGSSALRKADLLLNLAKSPFSSFSRNYVSDHFSLRNQIILSLDKLESNYTELSRIIDELRDRYETYFIAKDLNYQGFSRIFNFLISLDTSLLNEESNVSFSRFTLTGSSEIDIVQKNNTDYLRFSGKVTRFARILSVNQLCGDEVFPGLFISSEKNPLNIKGNIIIMSRFKPLTPFQQSFFFAEKKRNLERRNTSVRSMMRGETGLSDKERSLVMSKPVKERFAELESAKDIDVRWGSLNLSAMVFGTNTDELDDNIHQLHGAFNRVNCSCNYERSGLLRAYQAFLPSGSLKYYRDIDFNTSQFVASGLYYGSSVGMKTVPDYPDGEEFLYIFESKDGSVFHYNPFINGKGLVIIIGPVRSGKSFLRTILATHFGKYGGLIRMLDVDQGGEPVALCYGDDGAVFRLSGDEKLGLNLFSTYLGKDDHLFIPHLSHSLSQLLHLNDSEEMKTLSLDEQVEVDQAILSVLRLDKKLHSISSLVHHCSASVKEKFSRFTSGGLYGHVFDSEKDAIGSSHKSVVGYNLAAFKEDKVVLPYIMYEIFYRIISVFDSPEFLGVPKYADFDEAQVFFSIPGCAKMISSYVRTGGKKMSGISLTTQSPRELIEMDDWPMLRSASSTFIFMADPAMDIDLYKKAFHLTDAEVNHISNLKPRAEAYIVQREINVSKTILVDVEPEQEVISTSKPKERIIRENNIKKYGFEEGVDRTVRDLGFSTTS